MGLLVILDIAMLSQLWILDVLEDRNRCPGSHFVDCCVFLKSKQTTKFLLFLYHSIPLALLLKPSTENPSMKDIEIERTYVVSTSARFRLQL